MMLEDQIKAHKINTSWPMVNCFKYSNSVIILQLPDVKFLLLLHKYVQNYVTIKCRHAKCYQSVTFSRLVIDVLISISWLNLVNFHDQCYSTMSN